MYTNHSKVLFSPEIISMIFEHLDVSDLKNTRLTCQKWSEYGWCELQKNKACIRFWDGDKKVEDYINFFNSPTTAVTPLQDYTLSYEFKSGDLLTKFYQLFGPHMRSLDISAYTDIELDHADQKTLTRLEHFSFNCSEIEFPIVKELILSGENASLEIHHTNHMELRAELGTFLKQNSNVLKKLSFSDEHSLWYSDPPLPLAEMVIGAEFQNLKVLDMAGDLNDACMLALASGNLRLVELTTGIAEHSPLSFFKLLDSMKSTLKELSFNVKYGFILKSENCMFPRMEKLSFLQFDRFQGTFDVLGSEHFPVLEELYITGVKFESISLSRNISENGSEIQKLRLCNIYMDSFEHNAGDIGKMIGDLASIYPNLEDLFIWGKVAEEHLIQVQQSFPNLKNLTLSPVCNLEAKDHSTYLTKEISKVF